MKNSAKISVEYGFNLGILAYFFILLIIASFIYIAISIHTQSLWAQESSSDAIAIRVIPNDKHVSAQRWYQDQGFTGSPQNLTVDGYEAIRDGRTVYVNAANVIGSDLYTNIYLISFNQEAEQPTRDIFSQILSHWKFNTNLSSPGECKETSETYCLIDSDCPRDDYCLSQKAKIIRDTKRLANLAEIEISLEDYKNEKKSYPTLSAGSYLPQKTISTWPSWQKVLAQKLSSSLPVDPINELGKCKEDDIENEQYHEITCWNENTKEFADADSGNEVIDLPADSLVMVYDTAPNGSRYSLCAVMESGYPQGEAYNACPESADIIEIQDTLPNSPPSFIGENLRGYGGYPFEGFIEATDPDDDALIWTIDTSGASWPSWSAPPILRDTAAPGQKGIYAATGGNIGDYTITVTIDDSRGGIVSQDFIISIATLNVPAIDPVSDYSVVVGKNLTFTITANDPDSQYPMSFTFNNAPSGFTGGLAANQKDYNVNGKIEDRTQAYQITAVASDAFGAVSDPVSFSVTVTNDPPTITSSPITNAIACTYYEYPVEATDPNGHVITYYDGGSLPPDLNIDLSNGIITGQPQLAGTYPITLEVRDFYYNETVSPYSASNQQNYNLTVASEVFTVTPPTDKDIWVYANDGAGLYYNPGAGYDNQYWGTASVDTANPVYWYLSNIANPTPEGSLAVTPTFVLTINGNGEIQGTPTDNINDPGTYEIEVTAANYCTDSYSSTFNINVYENQWCGDSLSQAIHGEECDDGADGNDYNECYDDCTHTFCGDGLTQNPDGLGVAEQCDDANTINNDKCRNNCTKTSCGDGVVQAPNGDNIDEQCDDGSLNGQPNQCASDCQDITASVCGNDVIEAGEICDDGSLNGQPNQCASNCQGTSPSVCNNNIIEAGEVCDGTDLGGSSCASLGYNSGTLSCRGDCSALDSTNCFNAYIACNGAGGCMRVGFLLDARSSATAQSNAMGICLSAGYSSLYDYSTVPYTVYCGCCLGLSYWNGSAFTWGQNCCACNNAVTVISRVRCY